MCVLFCGVSCVEDVSTHLMRYMSCHTKQNTCSANTILRAIKELTTGNTTYTSPVSGKTSDFNTADTMNEFLVKSLISTGTLIKKGNLYFPQIKLFRVFTLEILEVKLNFTHVFF
mgnify:FL=1